MLAYLAIAVVVIVTPGQDTALTIRNTLAGGRDAGIRTALGAVCGQSIWVLTTSAGAAALLLASEAAFSALKTVGAAYLVYLGLRTLLAAARQRHDRATPQRSGHEFRQGLLSDLGNPKIAVFFTSMLPQFAGSFAGLTALGLLFSAMTLAWLALYATVVARAGDVLRRPRVRRALDAVTGSALVALGIRLAAERRA